ncbi:MAG: dephospho-CoA kinase [Verrucomicrobiales bacterium]|nr:dephospho-CoA kinase [Verrucomicrobiales bacterium]
MKLTIAVTGGVACGKSLVSSLFERAFPAGTMSRFNCDEAVASLYQEREVQERIQRIGKKFGVELISENAICRKTLRELLFENSEFREKIEAVLHPLVLSRVDSYSQAITDAVRISLIEVPLLYEVDFPLVRDLDLVVAASRAVQVERLCQGRGLDAGIAERIIDAQLRIENKIERGDIVVWNDSALEVLELQIRHLTSRCKNLLK